MISKDSLKKLHRLKNNKKFQYVIVGIALILLYKFYVWINTEKTDNAYVKADITLVSSEINGKVVEVLVKDNMSVKKGEVLARIDNTLYKANLEQAVLKLQTAEYTLLITQQKMIMEQTNLSKAKESLKLAEVNLEITERDYRRTIALNKDQFNSQKVVDSSKSAFEQAKNALAQGKLSVETAMENLEMLALQKRSDLASIESAKQAKIIAEKDMTNTVVISPIDGVSAGNGLRVGNFVATGMPLIYVVPNNIYVVANFKETQIVKFQDGQEVNISFDAISGCYKGKIRSISPASGATFSLIPVDNATGNFTKIVQRIPVIIEFDNSQKGLESLGVGMSTSVSVDTR